MADERIIGDPRRCDLRRRRQPFIERLGRHPERGDLQRGTAVVQQREALTAVEDSDLPRREADLATRLLDAAAAGELQIEIVAAPAGRGDVGSRTPHDMLRETDPVDRAVAEPNGLDTRDEARRRRRLRRQVHEGLADRLAIIGELLARPRVRGIPAQPAGAIRGGDLLHQFTPSPVRFGYSQARSVAPGQYPSGTA
ncbi:hypothetical protein ACVWW1_004811 [Bradyrhizobium sp. JR3.5]